MKKNLLSAIFFICLAPAVFAQYSRYIVRFTDKNGTPYSLSDPSAYLSAKAIARRGREQIAMDSTDLPIPPAYLDSIARVPNVTILNLSKWLNQVLIKTTDTAALSRISRFPFVKTEAPIAVRTARHPGNDPFTETFTPLSGYREEGVNDDSIDYGGSYAQIHIHNGDYLHNLGFTGQGMTIAVLDAGFRSYLTNPVFDSLRLQNRLLGTWDYVANEASVNEDATHGAQCLSLLAADSPGVMVGTAPAAAYWLFRTEDVNSEYPVEEQNWAAAAEYADSVGVDVISSSLGYASFDDPAFSYSYAQRDGHTAISTRAANLAAKKGILLTISAGNSGNDAGDTKYVGCPADADSVITVGATDFNGNIAGFSSWGPNSAGTLKPNIVSVGSGTVVANPNGSIGSGGGTSFSNPNVCGLITCLWQAFPEFSNMDIAAVVQESSSRAGDPDDRYGYGLPDFKKAFQLLLKRSFSGSGHHTGCTGTLDWTGKDKFPMHYEIDRKIGSDAGFLKIADISSRSDDFRLNHYTFSDTLLSGNQSDAVTYQIREFSTPDTSVVLFTYASTLEDPCTLGDRLVVRPNPVGPYIHLILSTIGGAPHLHITLQDALGRRYYQYNGSALPGNFYLDIPAAHLAAGMYLITIRDGNKRLYTRKIVK